MPHGRTVRSASRRSRRPIPSRRGPSRSPLEWWSAAGAGGAAGARPRETSLPSKSSAIGLDCTACTVVACDDDGKPLRPALLWMDQRAFREADEISATGDPVLRYVSGRVSPEWMLPKALWLKRNEPEIYEQRRPDRRVHRLDDVPADRRVDTVAEPRRGQVELRPARRRLAGRAC